MNSPLFVRVFNFLVSSVKMAGQTAEQLESLLGAKALILYSAESNLLSAH